MAFNWGKCHDIFCEFGERLVANMLDSDVFANKIDLLFSNRQDDLEFTSRLCLLF